MDVETTLNCKKCKLEITCKVHPMADMSYWVCADCHKDDIKEFQKFEEFIITKLTPKSWQYNIKRFTYNVLTTFVPFLAIGIHYGLKVQLLCLAFNLLGIYTLQILDFLCWIF